MVVFENYTCSSKIWIIYNPERAQNPDAARNLQMKPIPRVDVLFKAEVSLDRGWVIIRRRKRTTQHYVTRVPL
eukprot:scaffold43062_cov206-Amphora_coffeaeformis.AAC.2